MATKSSAPRRINDLKAREQAYGSIYVWLWRRRHRIAAQLSAGVPNLWVAAASTMAEDGVRSISGAVPTRGAVHYAWQKVAKHMADEARRLNDVTSANTGRAISRKKGWVPTSSPPPEPPAVQVMAQPSRAPGPPPPRQASPPPPPPTPPDPALPIEPGQTAPLGHPDHPLGALTALELAKLEDYLDCSVEIQRGVLRHYRHVRHLDRFSRPGWQ